MRKRKAARGRATSCKGSEKTARHEMERRGARLDVGGAWNTTGWGGKYSRIDQYLKTECILTVLDRRRWSFCLVSDLKFEENGVNRYTVNNTTWTMVIQGSVGVILDFELTEQWRESGANVSTAKMAGERSTRCMAVQITANGGEDGLNLVSVYAPTSTDHANDPKRRDFYLEVESVLRRIPRANQTLLRGDWNAEAGAGMRDGWEGTMGTIPFPRPLVAFFVPCCASVVLLSCFPALGPGLRVWYNTALVPLTP